METIINDEYTLHKMLTSLQDGYSVVKDLFLKEKINSIYNELRGDLIRAGYFKKPDEDPVYVEDPCEGCRWLEDKPELCGTCIILKGEK